jgi:hypothetical protein
LARADHDRRERALAAKATGEAGAGCFLLEAIAGHLGRFRKIPDAYRNFGFLQKNADSWQ